MNLELSKEEVALKELVLESNLDGFMKIKEESKQVGELIFRNKEKFNDYLLCIDEVFSNCISHAYKEQYGNVDVKFCLDEKYLKVNVKDYGIGIPMKYTKEIPKLCDNLLAESGRGLFIVNNICDKLIVKRKGNSGTEVIIHFERDVNYVS